MVETPFGKLPDGMKTIVEIHDPALHQIRNACAEWVVSGEQALYLSQLAQAVRHYVIAPPTKPIAGADGVLIQPYAEKAHEVLLEIAQAEAVKISKRRWLHYARRLPIFALDPDPGVDPNAAKLSLYHASIIDALTGLYGSDTSSERGYNEVDNRFEILDEDLLPLCRLTECARMLAEVQDIYRLAGRGARYVIRANEPLPILVPDKHFQAALSDFRRRLDGNRSPFLCQMGTITGSALRGLDQYAVVGLQRREKRDWSVCRDLGADSYTHETGFTDEKGFLAYTFFDVHAINFRQLAELFQQSPDMASELDPVIATSIGLLAAALPALMFEGMMHTTVQMYGKVDFLGTDIQVALRRTFPRAIEVLNALGIPHSHLRTVENLVDHAKEIKPSVWPVLRGSLVREDQSGSTLDLYGATSVIQIALRRVQHGGALEHFSLVLSTRSWYF